MNDEMRAWILVSTLVGAALTISAVFLGSSSALSDQRAGFLIAGLVGLGLLTLVAAVARWAYAIAIPVDDSRPDPTARRTTSRPRFTLFAASFVALFLELALIRYVGSQMRVFAFFKNVPLIAIYLGLGIGCAIGASRRRQALTFLLRFVPLAAALAAGPFIFIGAIARAAASATSEQMLGDVVVRDPSAIGAVLGQVAMCAVCFVVLLALASSFVPLGCLLGEAFERLPRLSAYTVNILGSLAGTAAFLLLSALWAPPWTWLLVGFAPLLWWVDRRRDVIVAIALIALSAIAVTPSIGETIWSPYQKLVGRAVTVPQDSGAPPIRGYRVDISDVFYQVAMDLRSGGMARAGRSPLAHYDAALSGLPRPIGRVLIVGSGTGNDVAAALRAGAAGVDAVDIDPAIIALGRQHHPEQPYADPRVHVIVDDARTAFRRLPAGAYDAVLFGLLDSHTQLGMSSVRLDNYVFTLQSFEEAGRLVRPGGRIIVTAATFRDWFRRRVVAMLTTACGSSVETRDVPATAWTSYECEVARIGAPRAALPASGSLPTDDWPFLYLPERGIPLAYVLVVAVLAFGSVLVLQANGLSTRRFTRDHAQLFCLGAAFLLMEVYAINRLALLFGTTWTISAVAILIVLTLIAAANLTITFAPELPYGLAYAGLFAALAVSYTLNPDAALGRGSGVGVAYGFASLLPVYFAGLIFARSFAVTTSAGAALGANMLGAVVGGWAEYASMALGIRALVLLAMAFYIGSFVGLPRPRKPVARCIETAK